MTCRVLETHNLNTEPLILRLEWFRKSLNVLHCRHFCGPCFVSDEEGNERGAKTYRRIDVITTRPMGPILKLKPCVSCFRVLVLYFTIDIRSSYACNLFRIIR